MNAPEDPRHDADEFYVGYLDHAPRGLGRWLRTITIVLLVAAAAVAAAVASQQRELPDGRFQFGVVRSFEGVLYESPIPTLRVTERDAQGELAVSHLLLVGFGKAGLPAFARGHDGQKIRFDGTLVHKGRLAMIEMNAPESFEVVGAPDEHEQRQRAEPLGWVTLEGELVDTKCYLGVMRPATGKVHRACAIRCLKGGVPPGLLLRDEDGSSEVVMLAGPRGAALDLDLEWAARTVRATGQLEMQDEVAVLRVSEARLVRD